jgi:hypothetical protein
MTQDTKSSADALADTFAQWTEQWRRIAEVSVGAGEAWSNSMLPFIMTRAAEKRTGLGDELSDAIERMAQGPKLADVWDIDRKLMAAFLSWTKMRQKLAAYNANASRPWMRAMERHGAATPTEKGTEAPGWRDDFAAWSVIANEELIRNQRSEEFLQVQRELLQAGIEFRKTQTDLNETVSGLFGLPTQRDFDELSRQLTELRREVRAMARDIPQPATSLSARASEQKGDRDE